ncbi:hypothetical protein IFM89_024134 [Coptis chinensis]|uniref:Uncharacterized protein n=1 Tax=Coptis chinensis TaxID=261450 RepID=A0A835LG73_9MAGN|nr:hypothetical protein IFM89_024134 [Coptis chinensis]
MVPAQSIYFGNNQRSRGSGEIFTGGKTISCYGGGGGGVYGSGTNFDGGATCLVVVMVEAVGSMVSAICWR